MPPAQGGMPTAALGGSALAINAFSEQPDAAYALIDYLLQPEQMLERARVAGQYPTRPALYETAALADALEIPVDEALAVIQRATPRPVTPLYSQLSDILQISIHRVLTRQQEPGTALREAAAAMRTLLARAGLGQRTS
jgi:multiple sugar transport system substrate-binding protein